MIYSTATVPVNPEGETKLTRDQAWKGLELKARDAREFFAARTVHAPRRRRGEREPLRARGHDCRSRPAGDHRA